MNEYVGAIHMHSIYSDGSGSVEEILQAAQEIGLDYIILTDHNTLRAKDEGYEGWHKNTFLLVGCEINDKENKNHYLAMNINKAFSTRLNAADYVKKVKDAGGIGFLAHPHEKRDQLKEHPPYPWTEWNINDFNGIEIWNHMSEWMENLTDENKYKSFLHPLKTIKSPPKETLKLWDKLNLKRPVVGIGGVDAHAHKYNLLGFMEVEIFPYKVLFKSIRTHLLTDETLSPDVSFDNSKKTILDSLKNGSCFFANDYLADSKGFRFFAENGSEKINMGKTTETKDVSLKVLLPIEKAEIILIRNGIIEDKIENSEARFKISKHGAYRVEVKLHKKAWIYSNHIRIGL